MTTTKDADATNATAPASLPQGSDDAGLRARALVYDTSFANDISALYHNIKGNWPASFGVFATLIFVFWNSASVAGAVAAVLVHMLGKWDMLHTITARQRDSDRDAHAKFWALRSLFSTSIIGLSWAIAVVAFFVPGQFGEQALLTLVILGLASATLIERISYRPSIWLSLLPMIATLVGFLFAENATLPIVTATLASIYLFMMLRWVIRLSSASRASISFERDNAHLAVDLAKERVTAEDTRIAAEKARDSAEAGNRTKSEFLATVSHEIRTPLNGILGMTNLLAESGLTPSQRSAVDDIRDAAEGLSLILNDILDLSRLEAGKFSLEPAPMGPRRVTEAVARMFQARAWEKNLDIEVAIDERTPASIRADAGRLRQVLINLVGNAIKFTDKGGVTISVEPVCDDAERAMVRFAVTDTGIGIPGDSFQLLFQNFSQLDQSYTRRFSGTGLGLAISRKLVALMGGEIGVTSELGVGSTFWLMVPAEVVSEDLPAPSASATPRASTSPQRPLRILAVDDNAINRRLISNMLTALGHTVVLAQDGLAAFEEVNRQSFDVILMDLHMPGVDGTQAARMIRAMAGPASQTPIIALTAHSRDRVREAGLAEGMNGVVTKPFAVRDLLAAIHVATANPEDAANDEILTVAFDASAIEGLERSVGRDTLIDVLRSYLETAADLTRRINDAAGTGDTPGMAQAARDFAGAAGDLGFASLTAAARALAAAARSETPEGDIVEQARHLAKQAERAHAQLKRLYPDLTEVA